MNHEFISNRTTILNTNVRTLMATSNSSAITNTSSTSLNASTIVNSTDQVCDQRQSRNYKKKPKPKRQNSVGNTDSESTSETE